MRWRIAVAAAGALFLLVIFLYLQNRDEHAPLLVAHPGYNVYREHCRRCHGNFGNAQRASRMADRRLDLGSPLYRDTTAVDTIQAVIANGKGRMKGYATKLNPAELEAVTSYILELPEARRRSGKL